MIPIRMNCQSKFMPRGTLHSSAGSIETAGRGVWIATELSGGGLRHKLNHEYQEGCRSQDAPGFSDTAPGDSDHIVLRARPRNLGKLINRANIQARLGSSNALGSLLRKALPRTVGGRQVSG
jgi:hypothetical protein